MGQSSRHSLAMNAKIVFPTILFIFICLFENSSCLKCFQCNSDVEAHCDDPFSHQLAGEYLYYCPENENGKEYFCQKMVYYTSNGESIVQRSCQHVRKDETEGLCHTTTVDGGNAVICECEFDTCNTGRQLKFSFIAILPAALLAYLRH